MGKEVREILKGYRERLSSTPPSPEAVKDAFHRLSLGRHKSLVGKQANTIAAFFARLPDDLKQAMAEFLNGPTIDLATHHLLAIKAIHLEAMNVAKKEQNKAKADQVRASSGDDGPALTRAEERELRSTYKQRCLPEKLDGLPGRFQLLQCVGESGVSGFDCYAPAICLRAASNLSGVRSLRLYHAIRHQAIREGFPRGLYPGRAAQHMWGMDPDAIRKAVPELKRSGLVLCEKDPRRPRRWCFTLLGLWPLVSRDEEGKKYIRLFYNGVQLRHVDPKDFRQVPKPRLLYPGSEKFCEVSVIMPGNGGQVKMPSRWMCGGESFFFTERRIKRKLRGGYRYRCEYRAYLGGGPMPEACKRLACASRKRPQDSDHDSRWLSPAEVQHLLDVVSFWEPLEDGAKRPDHLLTHSPDGKPIPVMPTLRNVELDRQFDDALTITLSSDSTGEPVPATTGEEAIA